jgi:hypothetical protein
MAKWLIAFINADVPVMPNWRRKRIEKYRNRGF